MSIKSKLLAAMAALIFALTATAAQAQSLTGSWRGFAMGVTVGGYYTQQPTNKPPGGTWRLQFSGPNSVTMTDVNLGGSITFNRVG